MSKLWVKRAGLILLTSVMVLSSAASCSLADPFNLNPVDPNIYGALKLDPEVKDDGFGRINKVKIATDQEVQGELGRMYVREFIQTGEDQLVAFTNQGVYDTDDGGRVWTRRYLGNVQGLEAEALNSAVVFSNNFGYYDMSIHPDDSDIIYVSGQGADRRGQIFKTVDGGDSYERMYTDINTETAVRYIAINPRNTREVFAALSNDIIATSDAGDTWKKVYTTAGQITGLWMDEDKKLNVLTNTGERLVQSSQLTDTLEFNSENFNIEGITTYKDVIEQNGELLVVTNEAVYYGKDKDNLERWKLPIDSDVYNATAVTLDPEDGANRVIVIVGNKFYETTNKGQSWKASSEFGLDSGITNINTIHIDEYDNEVIYLGLGV